jgi:hypothetical protein
MALTAAAISAVSFGLYKLASVFKTKNAGGGPCIASSANAPAEMPFVLPQPDGQCPKSEPPQYDLVFFSPEGNPTIATNEQEPDGTRTHSAVVSGIKYTYQAYTRSTSSEVKNPVSNVNCYINAITSVPLNMAPQLLRTSDTAEAPISGTATFLPLGSLSPTLVVTCGLPNGTQISENWPAVDYSAAQPPAGAPVSNGLATVMYIEALNDCYVYLEIGGARGGNVEVYTSGIDPISGTAKPLDPSYVGGKPGVVFGTLRLVAGDVLKVFLGSQGTSALDSTGALIYDGNGQAGLGTIYGGSNGGGPTYIVKYDSKLKGGALSAAYEAQNTYDLIAVAAGGGGASRNASGGSGGLNADFMNYGQAQTVSSVFGSSGGKSFILGPAPYVPGRLTNDFSGGGGLITIGGASLVTSQQPSRASEGSSLKPFVGQISPQPQGGASVNTVVGSGGGGGGGGYYGGGAGGFNGYPKPNNVHGAGGGGSSFLGSSLEAATKGLNVNMNAYRAAVAQPLWDPLKCNTNGYLLIGLPAV